MSANTSRNLTHESSKRKQELVETALQVAEGTADSRASKGADGQGSTLFISNLPYSATSTDLLTHFSSHGPVRSAFVVLDRETKLSKGVGYVSFAMKEDGESAVEEAAAASVTSGVALFEGGGGKKGRKLGITWADKKPLLDEDTPARPQKKARVAPTAPPTEIREESTTSGEPSSSVLLIRKDPKAIRTLVISNLPNGLTKAVLWKKIRKSGDCELIFPVEGSPESEAHVIYPTASLASNAVSKFHGATYKDSLLSAVLKKRVEEFSTTDPSKKTKEGQSNKGGRLILRNLPWDITEKSLSALFIPYGPIHSINLPPPIPAKTEGGKARARGFAFVWMVSRKDAENAIDGVNGKVLGGNGQTSDEGAADNGGRKVAVDWALSKERWEAEKTKVDETAEAVEEKEGSSESDSEEDSDSEEAGSPEEGDDSKMEVDDEKASDAEEEVEEEIPVKPTLPKPEDGCTLFVRNLSFEAKEEELRDLFRSFGPLRYARITMDKATGRSRGSGFVCFWNSEDADKAIEEASLIASSTGANSTPLPARGLDKVVNPFAPPSVLMVDPSAALARSLVMHGRVLDVQRAVTREEAGKIKEDGERRKEKGDKKNTYLMREGVIFPGTPAAKTLPDNEVAKRVESFNSRKTLLSSNPSLYISKTRISIRQIPLFATDRTLKRLAIYAAREFDDEVKGGSRDGLDEDEARDTTLSAIVLKQQETPKSKKKKKERDTIVIQSKIVRASDRIDPVSGLGKSKGYGFLELRSHQDALKVLRWANNNPKVESLMRGWWKVEVEEGVERLKEKIKALVAGGATVEVAQPSGGDSDDSDDSDDDDKPRKKKGRGTKGKGKETQYQDKKSDVEDLQELQSRLKRMQEKVKELEGPDDPRGMKKTMIVEFSIENVQVVKRRVEKVGTSWDTGAPRKRRAEDGDDAQADPKRRRGPKERLEAKAGSAIEPQPTLSKEEADRKNLGLLIGKKRKERRAKSGR